MDKRTKAKVGRPPTFTAPRETILSQAAILFAAGGFESTSLQQIAEAVGITKAAVYHYFPTKQAVYDAIVVDLLERLDTYVEAQIIETQPHHIRLKTMMISHADFFEENYSAFVTLLHGIAGRSRPISEQEAIVRNRYEQRVRDILFSGTNSDAFVACQTDLAARAVLSLLNWMSRWYKPTGSKRARDFAEEYFEIVYEGLRPRDASNKR